MSQKYKHTIAVTLMAALTGCSLAPVYERPVAPISEQWPGTTVSQAEQAVPEWRGFILDPALRDLIETALGNNRSLRQSLLDIEQARAQYRIQRADRLPGVSGTAAGTRQRSPAGLEGAQDPTGTPHSAVSSNYQVGLSLPEYELDMFGRVRSLTEAALAQYLATEEAGRAARTSLIAEVARAYLTYNGAEQRLELTRQTLMSRENSLELISQRRTAGDATALDYQEAVGLVEQARAEMERNEREKRQSYNALTLLVGTTDAGRLIPDATAGRPLLLQDIGPGAPSHLIERRPDIKASEHRLRARNADIGAARAAFFPRITLTGFLGSSSSEMSGLFEGGSRAWTFMPSLSVPIFAGGRNRANLDLAQVRKESAIAEYEGTIQTAFREVADALAATDTLRREESARRALADASQASLTLARARYEGGVDSHLRYLDAQRAGFENETGYIDIATQRQLALVDLFRTLGGGWETGGVP